MTRINLIPPSELHQKHLGAEYYELPEIFFLVRKRQAKGDTARSIRHEIPPTYRFGTGHKLFFYDKLNWLTHRYMSLVEEMRGRGGMVNPKVLQVEFGDLNLSWWGLWDPPQEAIDLSRARIQQREKELGFK